MRHGSGSYGPSPDRPLDVPPRSTLMGGPIDGEPSRASSNPVGARRRRSIPWRSMTAPVTSPPERLRADARANRDAIVAAAAELYAQHGPDVPFAEIAKAAGVGRATLARRFPTRDALRLAVLEQLIEALEELAAGVPDEPAGLMRLLDEALALIAERAALVDLLRSAASIPAGGEPLLERSNVVFDGPLRRAQAAGLVAREIEPEDVRLVLTMVSAAARVDRRPGVRERAARMARRAIGLPS
jgi:AcrR family transcriptional regulator